MKKIVNGKVLQEKMQETIKLLCDTVKTTLGPKGNNVIIDHSSFTPFITNDGATIAMNIESDDAVINTILEIAKEASLKTNEIVGDGTTTTLVILQSIFNSSLQYIKNGTNPICLKNELNQSLIPIIKRIESLKIKPTNKHLQYIAQIAANDENLGKIVSEAYQKVASKSAISICETDEEDLSTSYLTGYIFDSNTASEYFFKNKTSLDLDNINILLINDIIYDIESISTILNHIIKQNQNLLIIANDFEEQFIKEIISLYLNEGVNCFLLKITEYGFKQQIIFKDLETITNAKIIENINNISLDNIGFASNVIINKNNSRIDFKPTKKLKEYLSVIKQEEKQITDEFDKDFYQKRIAMFSNGIAKIYLGSPTKTERREKKMRLEDALCALESAKGGVLPGSGITLLKISEEMKINSEADQIFKDALSKPFEQILKNAGLKIDAIKSKTKESEYQLIYNLQNNEYETIPDSSVLDSLAVVKNSLINATSIATMLLTTTSLIINEYKNDLEKVSEFNEI